MDLDQFLCYCFHIKKRKIVNFVRQTRPRRASQVSECFGAGTGCGWCIPYLKRIHAQILRGDAIEAADIGSGEYELLRRRYLAGIKDGSCERNTHDVAAAPVIEGAGCPPGEAHETEPGMPSGPPAPADSDESAAAGTAAESRDEEDEERAGKRAARRDAKQEDGRDRRDRRDRRDGDDEVGDDEDGDDADGDDADGWDVSHYFSRPRPPDPEPETLS